MAITAGKIEIPVEATVKIRVGEHEVKLAELAAALTKAGVELQALVAPKLTVDASTYASPRPIEVTVDPTDTLRPGDGIIRGYDCKLYRIEVDPIAYAANQVPRVNGYVKGPI